MILFIFPCRDTNDQLPIHIAAGKGLRNTVELLLREDPDAVDAVDNHGQSPLLVAAKNGFPNVVSYLLAKNAHYGLKDKLGLTAFDWAVRRTFPDVVQVFLEIDEWKEVNRMNIGLFILLQSRDGSKIVTRLSHVTLD